MRHQAPMNNLLSTQGRPGGCASEVPPLLFPDFKLPKASMKSYGIGQGIQNTICEMGSLPDLPGKSYCK
eukprot:c41924_g1_i1 orf=3-206(-)